MYIFYSSKNPYNSMDWLPEEPESSLKRERDQATNTK